MNREVVVLVLSKEEGKMLVEMLEEYLDKHSHDIADFYDYWEDRINLVERIKKAVNEERYEVCAKKEILVLRKE